MFWVGWGGNDISEDFYYKSLDALMVGKWISYSGHFRKGKSCDKQDDQVFTMRVMREKFRNKIKNYVVLRPGKE